MIKVRKLPIQFDAEGLKLDVMQFGPGDWTPHFNTQYYEGDWSGIALRAVKDGHMELYPDPVAANGFVDTKGLERCPHTRQALARFECELETARFLRLGAGSSIREHRDHKLGYEDGIVRVHVPVLTNDKVTFMLGGEFVRMLPGEAWYLNFNLPHSVQNGSEEDRVHLVVDCVVNDWLRGLLLD